MGSTMTKTIDEMAMEYAMAAPDDYDSLSFTGDIIEHKQARIKHLMVNRFGAYATQEAIRKASETLRLVNFHPKDSDECETFGVISPR